MPGEAKEAPAEPKKEEEEKKPSEEEEDEGATSMDAAS